MLHPIASLLTQEGERNTSEKNLTVRISTKKKEEKD
jgi:hypothetical protein